MGLFTRTTFCVFLTQLYKVSCRIDPGWKQAECVVERGGLLHDYPHHFRRMRRLQIRNAISSLAMHIRGSLPRVESVCVRFKYFRPTRLFSLQNISPIPCELQFMVAWLANGSSCGVARTTHMILTCSSSQ